jgi:hypothetical protein
VVGGFAGVDPVARLDARDGEVGERVVGLDGGEGGENSEETEGGLHGEASEEVRVRVCGETGSLPAQAPSVLCPLGSAELSHFGRCQPGAQSAADGKSLTEAPADPC